MGKKFDHRKKAYKKQLGLKEEKIFKMTPEEILNMINKINDKYLNEISGLKSKSNRKGE